MRRMEWESFIKAKHRDWFLYQLNVGLTWEEFDAKYVLPPIWRFDLRKDKRRENFKMPEETKERKIRRIVGCWKKKLHKIGNTGKTFKEKKLHTLNRKQIE